MKIFSYHPVTRHFVEVAEADPDPMQPGEYIVPAFSTTATPPAVVAGQAAVYLPESDRWEVQTLAAPEPEPEPEPIPFSVKAAAWRAAVKEHADMVAAAFDFDDIAEAVTYADEPAVPKFQMLGAALRAWRSLLWEAFDAACMQISAGHDPEPATKAELIALLPAFEAPNTAVLDSTPYVPPVADESEVQP